MKLSDAFPSNFLAASEMNDEFTATMSHLQEEDIGPNKDKKFVLYFKGTKKGLVLNVTNWKAIEKVYGDSDNWAGQKITLYPTETNFKGEMVQAIRVRIPRIKELAPWEDPPKPNGPPPATNVGSREDSLITEGEAIARQGVVKFRDWRDRLSEEEHALLRPHLSRLTSAARMISEKEAKK